MKPGNFISARHTKHTLKVQAWVRTKGWGGLCGSVVDENPNSLGASQASEAFNLSLFQVDKCGPHEAAEATFNASTLTEKHALYIRTCISVSLPQTEVQRD